MSEVEETFTGAYHENPINVVVGRQITNNTMIAQERFHALRMKPGGQNKVMAIKTSISKVCD